MSVNIKRVSDSEITVNGHTLYLDANGNWIGGKYLSTIEQKAATCYLAALNNKNE